LKTWLQWEADLNRLTPPEQIMMGLDRVQIVASRLPIRPQPARVCTIAGTNGKGSTVEALGALAQASGLRYAQYTSPHLCRFTERIRINGAEVSETVLAQACDQVEAARGETFLTFFEFTTLAALVIFTASDLDLWILEVGLGGRLDAVNILDADVSVITQIGLDHQAYLGETIEAIAREKAGILRAQRPAWTVHQMATPALMEVAAQCGAMLHVVDWMTDPDGRSEVEIRPHRVCLSALDIPVASAALALAAASTLGLSVSDPVETLQRVSLLGRMTLRTDPRGVRWWFDVAHNPQAVAYVMTRWRMVPVLGRRFVILGLLADKDASGVLAAIDADINLIVVGLTGPRGRSAANLAQHAAQQGRTVWRSFDTLQVAMNALPTALQADDAVVVLGSFLMVADALTHDDFL
jgi:dihydrofolate synthase / folylpolyglutamate synthase